VPSIFSKIVKKELSCFKVFEDNKHLAFLDINPNTKGHTLCIPKKENEYIFDMSETEFINLMKFARVVAKGIEKSIKCSRVAVSVVGLEINHTHIHLIPIKSMKDVDFNYKVSFSEEEMINIAKKINDSITY
tara:strand:+ start:235 stop:630 length:396 start_codon:yes stop_codon:yes gene_type:complete